MALVSWRVWAAVGLALMLAGSHWKAYHSGAQGVQIEWDAQTLAMTQAALVAQEAARAKEADLQTKVKKVSNEYAKANAARVAADTRAADSLQRLNAALGGQTPGDPAAPAGIDDDPRPDIIAGCTRDLVILDKAVRGLASQTTALQDYTRSVCLTQ
mgnify:FL=1